MIGILKSVKSLVMLMLAGGVMVCAGQVYGANSFSLNVSTGQDTSGVIQNINGANDAHWQINGLPAKVVTNSSADWWGGWQANDGQSSWIARDPSNNNNGTGVYTNTFDLTTVNLSTVVLSGGWDVDDEGSLSINGHVIGTQVHDGWQSGLHPFSITDLTWFNQGSNTLTLTISNSDNFFEGVRLQGSVVGSVPEPGTLAVLALGAVGVLGRKRR